MRPRIFVFLLALMLAAASASAQIPSTASPASVVSLGVGANGIWNASADPFPADVEAAAGAVGSLSPHLSLVANGEYGFARAYFRGAAGLRVTATDVDNRDFSIGLGVSYHVASAQFINEWAPEAAVGYRPWPARFPKLALVGLSWYGLQSKVVTTTLGARWRVSL